MKTLILGIVLGGCAKTDTVVDTDDTDVVVDTDVVDTGPTCVPLVSGEWSGAGAAFGMRMGVTLTMTDDECSFTLTNWSMEMGPIADGGAEADDQVTLSGPVPYWSTCVGTADADGKGVDGVCSEDNAAFVLNFRG